ncbi:trypsin-like serine peptidase [Kangsaoukella pontilimi]|nr:trypsin-like serine protease [Kangsaoukella pontilimi]
MLLRAIAVCLLALLLPADAPAQDLSASAGRLERLGVSGTCSATLVRPDVAVTAAHCVRPDQVRQGDAPQLFFRPGWPRDAGRMAVVDVVRHPLYAPAREGERWRFPFDIAVVRLARALPERVNPPLALGRPPEPGEYLTLVSWKKDQDAPVLRPCQVVPGVEALVTIACRVAGGESGGAVIRAGNGAPEIVAVLTSRAQIGSLPVGQASALELRLAPMLHRLD